MLLENRDLFTFDEKVCLKQKFTFPALTKSILSKIQFKISEKDIERILEHIDKEYGCIINLNQDFNLKLQYHGRFDSFLIGFEINPKNENQPDFKLLRIETRVEKTHKSDTMCFLGLKNIKGPHFHWYNNFYRIFTNRDIFNLHNPNEETYNNIIKVFLDNKRYFNFNINLLRKAVPYRTFLELCKLVINEERILREDGYITINKTLKKDSSKILDQILKRELF